MICGHKSCRFARPWQMKINVARFKTNLPSCVRYTYKLTLDSFIIKIKTESDQFDRAKLTQAKAYILTGKFNTMGGAHTPVKALNASKIHKYPLMKILEMEKVDKCSVN